jgi:tetratricopeptide (TPR) repeat protein
VHLQRALEWHESILGTKDSKILDDLLLSINLDLRTKNFDRALATAKRIQEMDIAAHTADSLPVADGFLRIGQIYLAERKPQDAVHALQKAYALRTKLAGPLDPGLLPILDGLNEGFRAIVGGPGTGTESSYKQALMIRETLYGEESSELISTIEWLAETYVAEGQYLAAEPLYDRLLSLWEKLAGKDHPMVAITLDNLAALYLKEGKADKAREASARSITIRARFLAVSLLHQAVDAISAGDPAHARALCSRALAALAARGASK